MAATFPEVFKEPKASPFRPKGPSAMLMLPPRVSDPADMKERFRHPKLVMYQRIQCMDLRQPAIDIRKVKKGHHKILVSPIVNSEPPRNLSSQLRPARLRLNQLCLLRLVRTRLEKYMHAYCYNISSRDTALTSIR